VNLSLRPLFGKRSGRRAAPPAARPARTTQLRVEALEARTVPTVMNLTNYLFPLPGAVLHVTSENVATGVFHGTFDDVNTGININVTGKLTPIVGPWDSMRFQGTGAKGCDIEHVWFGGVLHEAAFPLMEGKLTEQYTCFCPPFPRTWVKSTQVEGYGHPWIWFRPINPVSHADAPFDAVFSAGDAGHTAVPEQS
jgi:hypothetical protein